MKKSSKILALLLVCIMIVSVTACNKTDNGGGATTSGGSEAQPSTSASGTQPSASTGGEAQTSGGGAQTSDGGGSTASTRDTLTVSIPSDFGSLNPSATSFTPAPAYLIQEAMWDVSFTGEMIFRLAESYEKITPDHWTIHLREGVKFNNGNPFTASDVLFTLQVYRNSGLQSTKAQVMDLDRTKAIDDYTLDFYWDYWRTNMEGILSDTLIFDEESYEEQRAGSNPIGTGPYILKEYVVNSYINLEARDDYWGDPPAIKNINLRVMAESSQVLNAVETHELDIGLLARSDIAYANTIPGVYTEGRYEGNWTTVRYNIHEPSFFYHNPEARYAVCYAIDTQAIIDLVYLGMGSRMHSPITNTCLDYEARFDDLHDTYKYGFNLDLARQYADSSGLTGRDITLITNGTADHVTIAELIQNMLKEINVNVTINNYDPAGYTAAITDRASGWDMSVTSAINPGNRVGATLVNGIRFYPDMQLPGLFTELDRFMEIMLDAFTEVDDQKRSELNYELFGLYGSACFVFALCDVTNTYAYSEDVDYSTVVYSIQGRVIYRDIAFK